MTYLFGFVLAGLLTYAFWIDLTRLVLPNWLNFILLATGLIRSLAMNLPEPVDALIGILAGGLCLGIIAVTYRHYRGFDGLGMGDVKFAAAAGAWIGWMGLPQMLLIASVLGLIYALGYAVVTRRLDHTRRIPFGPFLAVGTMASWLMLVAPPGLVAL